MECPLKYKLKYVDGLKEKPKPYLSFGSSLHLALEFMYSHKPFPPTLNQVLKHYEDNWISDGYASSEEEEGYFAYGRRILTEYYEKHVKDLKSPMAVEYLFNLKVEDIPVTGFIDRVDKIEEEKAEIIDYKSGKRGFTQAQVAENEQLTFYQWAVEESLRIPVGKLTLYHLPSQTPVSVGARPQERLDELKGKVLMVAHLIEKGEFEPRRNRFCPCDFGDHCPLFEHMFRKGKKKRKQQSLKEFED
jgi:putative RecB family exonuclease